MEYTEHKPCKTHDEVRRYYQRAGQLVGLLYVLQASDMHYENIIANGEYPIPIDLETIVTPLYLAMSEDTPVPGLGIRNTIDYAVSQSTLLPMKLPVAGRSLDLSFLGCVSAFDAPSEVLHWEDINTDTMIQTYGPNRLNTQKNSVVFNGSIVKASDYLEDIVTGFRAMYSLLMIYRDDLLAPWGPLASFIGCPIRYLFRSTFVYEKLLRRLNHPLFLRDGVDRWIEMQIFKRPLLKKNADPRLWAIVDAEMSALEQLDVPRFVALPQGNDLFTESGTTIENALCRSALEQIRACLVRLSAEDLERQTALIYDAFANTSIMPGEASTS
jgi:type 2 lantibiotic biosynthesis protein LanM